MCSNDRVIRNLNAAITAMKNSISDAERAIEQYDDFRAIQAVLHASAWGSANASSHIENAMSAYDAAQELVISDLREDE